MPSTTRIGEAALSKSAPRSASPRRPFARTPTINVGLLAQRVAEIEARIAAAGETNVMAEPSDGALASAATKLYQARRRRTRHLPAQVLGEPGWDILLDLFVAAVRGKPVRTTSAALASRSPGTTGLRWLAELEAHRLIERYAEIGDRRVKLVRLTRTGFQSMRAYLVEALTMGEPTSRRSS